MAPSLVPAFTRFLSRTSKANRTQKPAAATTTTTMRDFPRFGPRPRTSSSSALPPPSLSGSVSTQSTPTRMPGTPCTSNGTDTVDFASPEAVHLHEQRQSDHTLSQNTDASLQSGPVKQAQVLSIDEATDIDKASHSKLSGTAETAPRALTHLDELQPSFERLSTGQRTRRPAISNLAATDEWSESVYAALEEAMSNETAAELKQTVTIRRNAMPDGSWASGSLSSVDKQPEFLSNDVPQRSRTLAREPTREAVAGVEAVAKPEVVAKPIRRSRFIEHM